MSFILTKNAGVPVKYLIEGYVEQDTDRAQLRTDYTLGSKIKVIETGKTYVLTENGWKYLEENSFDPSILDDYYTKEETDELIATLNSFVYVDTLPTENIKTNVIYLVPAEDPGDDDIKDEYLNLDGTSAGWERIGSTKIDLTQYYTKTETDAKFVEKEAGKGLSTNDYTTAEKQKLAGLNASDFATAAQGVKADNAETKNIEQDGRLDTLEDEIIVTKTISGDFLHITDAAELPAEECVTTLEPVQDLHGYDKPWPAGGGKNLLPITAESQTINGVTFTVNKDDAGNVVSVTVNGTASGITTFDLYNTSAVSFDFDTILSGCPSGGSVDTYILREWNGPATVGNDFGSGVTISANTNFTRVDIRLASGYTANNLVFKPMIRLATVADATFEPYSNECPISGHTGIELTRTGKNLLPLTVDGIKAINTSGTWNENVYSVGQGTFELLTDGGNNVTGIKANFTSTTGNRDLNLLGAYGVATAIIPAGTYKISMIGAQNGATLQSGYNTTGFTTVNSSTEVTANATNGVGYVVLRIGSGISVNNLIFKPMIRLTTDADATFGPYTPETHSVTFPQAQSPVYGCEVDWVNGVLRVTKAYIDLGTKTYTKSQNAPRFYFPSTASDNMKPASSSAVAGNIICSQYATHSQNELFASTIGISIDSAALPWINIYDPQFANATAAEFKTAMSGVQLVYELAAPIEIPLTPEVITLLKGENNIWLDAGTFEKFEYYPDSTIGEQIGDLDKRVTDLENQNTESIIDVTVLPTGSAIEDVIYRLATTENNITTYTYYAGDATNQTTTEIPDKEYVDGTIEEYSSAYWIGTRAEYNALETPLADGTLVFITDDTLSYAGLSNKPSINNIILNGNKSLSDLGIAGSADYLALSGGALIGDVTTNVTTFTNNSLVPKSYIDTAMSNVYTKTESDARYLQEAIYDVMEIPYGSIEDVVYRLKVEPKRIRGITIYKRNTAANAEELAYAFTIEEDEYEGAEGYVARPKENTIVAATEGVIRAIWFGDTFDTFLDIGDEPYAMTETSEDFTLRINKYKFYMGNSTTQTAAEIASKSYVDDAIAAITDYESEVFPNG